MRYFTQSNVHGTPYPDCLWRYRKTNHILFEERWIPAEKIWQSTTLLTGMIIHGECTLDEISEDFAIALVPEAFQS